jgi:hypothetical protein
MATKTKRPTTKANARKYEQQWDVPSESDPSSYYTVSLTSEGEYKCHCWPYLRSHEPCKHIQQVTAGRIAPRGPQAAAADRQNWNFDDSAAPAEVSMREPRLVVCNVRSVTPVVSADGTEVIEIKTPAVPPGNDHFLLTVLNDLLRHGVSWKTLHKRYALPRDLTRQWVEQYIRDYGRLIYGPCQDGQGFVDYELVDCPP